MKEKRRQCPDYILEHNQDVQILNTFDIYTNNRPVSTPVQRINRKLASTVFPIFLIPSHMLNDGLSPTLHFSLRSLVMFLLFLFLLSFFRFFICLDCIN